MRDSLVRGVAIPDHAPNRRSDWSPIQATLMRVAAPMRNNERSTAHFRKYRPSDRTTFDRFGQLLDQVGNLFELGVHVKGAAERLERMLLVAELLHDHAKPG